MIKRKLESSILELVSLVPVVTILGPRQSGKTTLVRSMFPDFSYANLEDPATRALARDDYEGFFERFREPLIVDEVQRVPELLSAIQVRVDNARERNGRFILTGSHQPKLREGIAQSLAGRTSLVTLLPLSMSELASHPLFESAGRGDLILRGFMPELYRENVRSPSRYYRDYLQTYVERDLRNISGIKNLDRFIRFLKLLAARVGQIINLSSLGNETGVSSTTLAEWLSVLEASFIVFPLRPLFNNISKRLLKSPKYYFVEPGLAAYLLDLETPEQVERDPLFGSLFENLVVSEAMKTSCNLNRGFKFGFVRTAHGVEIDLVKETAGRQIPFEIKAAMTPNNDFAKNLKIFNAANGGNVPLSVIYSGEPYSSFSGICYINYKNSYEAIS